MKPLTILTCQPFHESKMANVIATLLQDCSIPYTTVHDVRTTMVTARGRTNPIFGVIVVSDAGDVMHSIFDVCKWIERNGLVPM